MCNKGCNPRSVGVLRGVTESLKAFGAVFASADLRRIQLAGMGSTLGGWAYSVGLGVYVYEKGGARAVGLVYFARWGSAALAAPWLSLFADRMSRRRLMLVADVARAALLTGMTVC